MTRTKVAAMVDSVKPLLPELLNPDSDPAATLVIILDGILTSIALMTEAPKEPKAEEIKRPATPEIHIEDIEAWHRGGRELWPRTSLKQFETIVRMIENIFVNYRS